MLTAIQALLLGAFQGVSELFPISSLGHSIILPQILGWNLNEQDPSFLVFLVATHFATAIVLFLFFWRDWLRILFGILRSLQTRSLADNPDGRLGWLLIAATVPAGILGLLFEKQIRLIFITATSAAVFLLLNGILLLLAEYLRRRKSTEKDGESDARIAKLSFKRGVLVGTMQALALMPGFSRTGSSLAGGLLVGLSHEDALRFSFLLATPIIGAAAALKLPKLFLHGSSLPLSTAFLGAAAAALFAYLSVKFLTRYFALESRTLTPFAWYCIAAGILFLILL